MPVTGAEWAQGGRGPEGSILVTRAGGAPPLKFEPAARALNSPMKIMESMTGRRAPGDGMMWAIGNAHCREIRYVVEVLAQATAGDKDRIDVELILSMYMQRAERIDDLGPLTTYGGRLQRYEAAKALSRSHDGEPMRYFVDAETGERVNGDTGEILDPGGDPQFVIPVGDLQKVARDHLGSSVPRGWLDTRMAELGWTRISIDGHRDGGRMGRQGPHAKCFAYRGVPHYDEGSVTT
jgi:hypothetical protein